MLGQVESCRLHIAGTPCVDYSSRGTLDKAEGKTHQHLYAWAGMRATLAEPVVVQENVENFSTAELQKLLGHLYHLDTSDAALLSPDQYGWPIARCRKWTILRHRYKTMAWAGPWSIFSKIFQCDMWFYKYEEFAESLPAWDLFFCGSLDEMFDELVWASARPDSKATSEGCRFKTLEEFRQAYHEDPAKVQEAFYRALTSSEETFLLEYQQRKPGQAYSLNQNPEVSATTSNARNLHTLIKNTTLVWWLGFICFLLVVRCLIYSLASNGSNGGKHCAIACRSDVHHRWLLAGEAMLCQAIPTSCEFTKGVPLSSFARADRQYESSRTARIGQAGNAMHCMVCGIALLYAVAEVRLQRAKGLTGGLQGLASRLRASVG